MEKLAEVKKLAKYKVQDVKEEDGVYTVSVQVEPSNVFQTLQQSSTEVSNEKIKQGLDGDEPQQQVRRRQKQRAAQNGVVPLHALPSPVQYIKTPPETCLFPGGIRSVIIEALQGRDMPRPARNSRTAKAIVKTVNTPELSFRGAKRRGNLAVPGRITGKPWRIRRALQEIATAPSGPRNDKLEGTAPMNLCRNHCLPAWRSGRCITSPARSPGRLHGQARRSSCRRRG